GPAARDPRRLNVAEGWNGGNQVLFYGKGGDIATNRRDEQELSVACLHVLQAAVAFVNTLLVQDVLAEPTWASALTAEDRPEIGTCSARSTTAERGRGLERRQPGAVLRQGRRHRHQPPRRAGVVGGVPARAAGCGGVRQHAARAGRPRRADLGQCAHRGGPA